MQQSKEPKTKKVRTPRICVCFIVPFAKLKHIRPAISFPGVRKVYHIYNLSEDEYLLQGFRRPQLPNFKFMIPSFTARNAISKSYFKRESVRIDVFEFLLLTVVNVAENLI